jgi:hypothetical protein
MAAAGRSPSTSAWSAIQSNTMDIFQDAFVDGRQGRRRGGGRRDGIRSPVRNAPLREHEDGNAGKSRTSHTR